jgi:hypothetical protein
MYATEHALMYSACFLQPLHLPARERLVDDDHHGELAAWGRNRQARDGQCLIGSSEGCKPGNKERTVTESMWFHLLQPAEEEVVQG